MLVLLGYGGIERQADRESAAESGYAVHRQVSSHMPDHLPGDGHGKPGSCDLVTNPGLFAVEWLEQHGLPFRPDPPAGVTNEDLKPVLPVLVNGMSFQRHQAATRMLHCVADKG